MAGKSTNGSEAGFNRDSGDDFPVVGNVGEIVSGSGDDAIPTIEPSTIPGNASDGAPRRGRRPGSRNASSNTKPDRKKEGKQDLTILLMGLHSMGAAFSKIPELELSEKEAKILGDSIQTVNDLYGGYMIPEKAQAWMNLAMAAGSIYGPRFMAHKIRTDREKEATKAGKQPQVIKVH